MNKDLFAKASASQREAAESLANKIKAGEELTATERLLAAGLIRMGARSIPEEQPAGQGAPGWLPEGIYLEFAMLRVHQRKTQTAAINELVQRYGVKEESIRERLGFKGKDPKRKESYRAKTDEAIHLLEKL